MKGMTYSLQVSASFFWQAPFRPLAQIGSAKHVPTRAVLSPGMARHGSRAFGRRLCRLETTQEPSLERASR